MNNEELLIAEIDANPKLPDPRLVYADWLEERGDLRGRYLRLETQLAKSLGSGHDISGIAEELATLADDIDLIWLNRVGHRFRFELDSAGDHQLWVIRCFIVTLGMTAEEAWRLVDQPPDHMAHDNAYFDSTVLCVVENLNWIVAFELKKYIDLASQHPNPPVGFIIYSAG